MNELEPKISLVVPIRNGMPFLMDTLNSISNLKSLPDQLVISNNSSTDDSTIVVNKFATIYQGNLKIVTTPSFVNVGESWNFAIENSNFNWVLMLHSDDLIHESAITTFRKIIKNIESDIDLIAGRCEIINSHGKLILGKYGIGKSVAAGGTKFLAQNLTAPTFNTGSICLKKSAWLAAGKFETINPHWCDLLFYHRVALKGRILSIPKVTARYRVFDKPRDADNRINREISNLEWFNTDYLPRLLKKFPELNDLRINNKSNIRKLFRSFSVNYLRRIMLFCFTILRRIQDLFKMSGFGKSQIFVANLK